MNGWKSRLVVWTLGLVVPCGALAGQSAGQGEDRIPPLPTKEDSLAEHKVLNAKRMRASQAMENHDYALAEKLFQEVCDLAPHPFDHIHLARLYDLQGREREALQEYEIVIKGANNSSSSLQTDPRVLSRFGDLCIRFRRERDAAIAYITVIESPENDESTNRVKIAPPDKSLRALRATAHIVAGSKNQWQGDWQGALAEYEIAVRTMPNWWMGWYFRGAQRADRTALRKEALGDLRKAERLALGKQREFVRERMAALRLPLPDFAP